MKPTYLYIKEHTITGMRYLGKTTKSDPYKYKGSGKHWVRHIKKHGLEHVKTVWVSELFTDESRLVEFALLISEEMDVVKSSRWANLKEENGLDGALPGITTWNKGIPRTDIEKKKMSDARKGIKAWNKNIPCKQETINKLKDRKRSEETRTKIKEARKKQVIVHSEDTKKKISLSHKGKIVSEDAKLAMRKPKSKIVCPHCNMLGGSNNMYRWHFNNCKLKGDNNDD